ncbi:MAG: hypothetical protein K2K82_04720 [Muribaculaceae bacterium]|nr:hypothetical protein [Muribaculaceae bacterium]
MVVTLCYARDYVTLADVGDKSPVVGASVISSNGLIIGITDTSGAIRVRKSDYPLSVRSLGYEPMTLSSAERDTVFLTPATYELAEITVAPEDRPITRVLTYAREYCAGATPTDTMQMYGDYMVEFFFAEGKVKGYDKRHQFPHVMACRRYGRLANAAGLDSIMRPKSGDDIAAISFFENMAFVPFESTELTDKMKTGAQTDTVAGKYGPKFVYQLNNGYFSVSCDVLSDHKNHTWSPWFFKVLGLTMDMDQVDFNLIYRQNPSGKHDIYDFISGTYNMHILGRGKQLKKMMGVDDAININCYVEQYPVRIEHLTIEEYKEVKKNYYSRAESFQRPANLQPLAPAIESLVGRF